MNAYSADADYVNACHDAAKDEDRMRYRAKCIAEYFAPKDWTFRKPSNRWPHDQLHYDYSCFEKDVCCEACCRSCYVADYMMYMMPDRDGIIDAWEDNPHDCYENADGVRIPFEPTMHGCEACMWEDAMHSNNGGN